MLLFFSDTFGFFFSVHELKLSKPKLYVASLLFKCKNALISIKKESF